VRRGSATLSVTENGQEQRGDSPTLHVELLERCSILLTPQGICAGQGMTEIDPDKCRPQQWRLDLRRLHLEFRSARAEIG
jgi:hypothetical protein